MGKRFLQILLMTMLLNYAKVFAVELKIQPSDNILPGSVLAIIVTGIDNKIKDALELRIDNKIIPVCGKNGNSLFAIYGVDLLRRGDISVELLINGTIIIKDRIKIQDHIFPVENLTLPPEKVFLSEQDFKRAEEEKRLLDSIWVQLTPERLWSGRFIEPAEGREGSVFGLRRIINGEERSPHTGRDIVAKEGTPVFAANRGRVVWTGELFFGGNSIVIDHGLGLYSMYFHLSKILVKKSDLVEKGQKIGHIGSTGRVSGPHLHWGLRLLNARVDPVSLNQFDFLQ